ncbi:pyroglutamyl-peptidase I [Streptomyces sp. NBC_01530]|uniref:pyroglutamyl-peptidase I family protein n=1 Tax=Streptomyces sp. NBC_01530 TaxID=2903895 RepID=UPI00386A91B3
MKNSLSSSSEATVSRVLLTGVEPFGRNYMNSAWGACRLVAESPPEDMQLEVVLLPCAFGDSIAELRKKILRVEPELVISTGQGGSRPDVTIERVAINLKDAEGADNNGNQPIDEPIVADGPAAYFSSIPVKACTEALLKAGIPTSVSHTAGTFLCNHIAFGLGRLIATEFSDRRGTARRTTSATAGRASAKDSIACHGMPPADKIPHPASTEPPSANGQGLMNDRG